MHGAKRTKWEITSFSGEITSFIQKFTDFLNSLYLRFIYLYIIVEHTAEIVDPLLR